MSETAKAANVERHVEVLRTIGLLEGLWAEAIASVPEIQRRVLEQMGAVEVVVTDIWNQDTARGRRQRILSTGSVGDSVKVGRYKLVGPLPEKEGEHASR